MSKKQMTILISLVLYTTIGIAAAGLLFFIGSGKKQSSVFSPSSIEAAEKNIIIENPVEEIAEDLQTSSTESSVVYYKFLTTNILTPLNVRTAPGMEAAIIATLPPSSSGYVLEKGEEWSKIKTDNLEGYCSNQYLQLEEISKEDYPY